MIQDKLWCPAPSIWINFDRWHKSTMSPSFYPREKGVFMWQLPMVYCPHCTRPIILAIPPIKTWHLTGHWPPTPVPAPWTWDPTGQEPTTLPLIVISGGHQYIHVQTCTLQEPPSVLTSGGYWSMYVWHRQRNAWYQSIGPLTSLFFRCSYHYK